jgi:hypothetical protein
VSPDSSVPSPAVPAAPPAPPLSEGTAFAVLGSMLLLIVALTILLVQTTRVDPARAAEAAVTADGGRLAQR